MDHVALVDALDHVWSSTSAVLHGIEPASWDRPTGCPGWTVKDQLSHLVWSADLWRGVAPAAVDLPELAHVQGPVGAYMELAVEARRSLAGVDVLAEFDRSRSAAIDDLRSRLPDGLDAPLAGPMGHEMPRTAFLGVSVFDQWVHGHDIRCALDVDADRDSPAAAHSVGQMLAGWAARLADGPSLSVVVDGHAHALGADAPVATVHLTWDGFVTRATGRDRPTGSVDIDGDRAAAERALDALPITP